MLIVIVYVDCNSSGTDVCLNACSHMCLPRVGIPEYTCHCPSDTRDTRYVLGTDGRTCRAEKVDSGRCS